MRICFLAPYAYPFFDPEVVYTLGGAERQQVRLARLLIERGHEVSFIVADFGQPARMDWQGIELIASYAVDSSLPAPLRLPIKYWKLLRAIHRTRDRLFYLRSNLTLAVLLWMAKGLFGVRYIYNIASDSDLVRTALDSRLLFALFFRAARSADGLITQTFRQQTLVRDRLRRASQLVRSLPPEPLEQQSVLPFEQRQGLLWVGRLEQIQKQPLQFVALAQMLPEQTFLLIGQPMGDAALTQAVRDAAAKLPNLTYRDWVPPDEISDYFRRARALVSTSTFEGFPNTYLEAWRSGTPVITRLDPERLTDRYRAGFIYDNLEQAAECIRSLGRDMAGYAEMSRGCLRLIAEEFDVRYSVTELEAALKRASRTPRHTAG